MDSIIATEKPRKDEQSCPSMVDDKDLRHSMERCLNHIWNRSCPGMMRLGLALGRLEHS